MSGAGATLAGATRSFLAPPWDGATENALFEHLRGRRGVRCFAVADADATRPERIAGVLEGVFELNGETHVFPGPIDWLRNPSADREWHIMLHKFYYAVGLGLAWRDSGDERYAARWIELTTSWIEQTPPGFIASDVTGRRVQNWIYAFHLFVLEGGAALPSGFLHAFLASLAEQVRYLCAHLAPERNHRTLALYAILLAGVVFPELRGAARWRRFALDELMLNIERDLLADGVQCEQSTDYHHIVLRNYLNARRLAAMNDIAVPARMDRLIQRALDFALHACKPDGVVPAFSDGDARSHRDVLETGHALYGRADLLYAASSGARGTPPARRVAAFPQAGYYVMRSGWGEHGEAYADARYLMYDCGPIGRGNHGHLDANSFELAAFGRSLVVDPGRYTYDESGNENWRRVFRGTAYHNTVTVDDLEQARYRLSGTRWRIDGPEPERELRVFASRGACDLVHGVVRSDEYDAVHERCIWFVHGEYWIVTDILRAPTPHRYDLRFHLGAHALGACHAEQDGDCIRIGSPGLLVAQAHAPGTRVDIERAFVSPRYGEKDAAPVLRFTREASTTVFHTMLHPFRDEAPRLSVQALPVTRAADLDGSTAGAWAARMQRRTPDGVTTDICFVADEGANARWRFANYSYDGSHLLLRLDENGRSAVLYADPGASLVRVADARASRGEQ
jgi:hypothetical protein